MKGYIHSVETFGTVDGPGIRFVVFLQGCPFRCQYCHNPDTWVLRDGTEIEAEELINQIKKVKPYMQISGGGVTISGGEPTLQKEFLTELLKLCKKEGFHTAIDTSGFISIEDAKEILEYTDLVLLDIKHINEEKHKQITGFTNKYTLELAKYLHEKRIPFWIRYVLVPGLTDNLEDIKAIKRFIDTIPSVKKIEVLPYHTMGKYKWNELGLKEELTNVAPPSEEQVKLVESILTNRTIAQSALKYLNTPDI